MAKSDAEICNIALQRVGVTLTIDGLDQKVKEAMVCKLVYETVRERVLGDFPWPFARRYKLLNLSGATPLSWRFRYVYPNECVAIRGIFPATLGADPATLRRYSREVSTPHEVALDDVTDERTILTDLQAAAIEYTAKITNPARFDAAFSSAFAWAIAAEIAIPLARDPKYMSNALAMYDREIQLAAAKSLNEEGKPEQSESEFILARL